MVRIKEIVKVLESFAPLAFQETYDNSGLIYGNVEKEISGALVCVDVSEEVIDEAIESDAEMIISHHPPVFEGIKKLTGKKLPERILIKAIRNDIALYASHTNLDNVEGGINSVICSKLNLVKCRILQPRPNGLCKLVTFVPKDKAETVREALFAVGCGNIGNYDKCSYNIDGTGTFRGDENTNPYVGEKETLHCEPETRIETIFPVHLSAAVTRALIESHPYEEPAYDIYSLENTYLQVGSGMIGQLPAPVKEKEFLENLKKIFNTGCVRYSGKSGGNINTVAVCGGSGAFLINRAISEGADIFITGDVKYHNFFDAENKIVVADVGHYESEQFAKELLSGLLNKNLINFAVQISKVNTNPIKYL